MDIKVLTDIIGYVAAAFGTCIFLPQVIQSYKTKQTTDVSLLSFILITIGSVMWITYGLLISALTVVVVNTIILVLSVIMLILKRRYG